MQAADEFSLTLALKGYQPQTVSVRKDEADSSKLAPNPIKVELQPVKKRAALTPTSCLTCALSAHTSGAAGRST